MRILVVDDCDDIRRSMADMLTLEHHDVLTAATGRQALERLTREGPVDVVITDLKMPGIPGEQFLDELKALPSPPPIIILTGMEAVPRPVSPVIAAFRKPVAPEQLLETLESLQATKLLGEVLHAAEEDEDTPVRGTKK